MYRSGSSAQARILQEAAYARLKQSFATSQDPMYRLRTPWLSPCTLGESHTVDGALQALTLIYGPWDTEQPHVRVTTWRELPGQDFAPDAPAGLLAAARDVTVDIEGGATPGTLVRLSDETWLLRVDSGPLHLLASGRGPSGELSFERLTDLTAVVDARRVLLASLRRDG
ncbi:hypothetical protein [Streptomyces sp. NBC_01198]|uniref:hypothetical protein n=1 Tax=Streptomyces sp. NBC_01198 TaxID=2903769 RepID=UPI002E143308|nr:hypothetical protein OG702_03090 [Streptomyces sp. NBC_01198]